MVWHKLGYHRFLFFLLGYSMGMFLCGVRVVEGAAVVVLLYVTVYFMKRNKNSFQ